MKNYPNELVKEYESLTLGCCHSCRSELNNDELLLFTDNFGDQYNECPECSVEVYELDKLTLDEYADSLIEKGVKIEDYN